MEQDRPQGAHGRREESQRGGVPGESFRHCFQLIPNVTTRFDSLWTLEVNLTYEQAWASQHQSAENALEKRDKLLADSYNRLENKMRLVGATGIEDRLQEGVPEVIARLREAGIVVWVLTGDKQETAINIGYSSNLLQDDMADEPFIVDGFSMEEVTKQLIDHRRAIEEHQGVVGKEATTGKRAPGDELSMKTFSAAGSLRGTSLGGCEEGGGLALIINGHSLVHALTPELELVFLGVAEHCQSVICCRVTPLQKALVVELVKKYKEAVCLAIGDGANDVSMIKAADIGVGVSGQEGMQAVLASDYSIAQFRYIRQHEH